MLKVCGEGDGDGNRSPHSRDTVRLMAHKPIGDQSTLPESGSSSGRNSHQQIICFWARYSGLEPTGAIEFFLFLGVVHFRVKIDLGNFERLMSEPALDLHQVEARAQPVGSRSFPEPVEIMLPAYRASLTRYLGFVAIVVSPFTNHN